MTRSGRKPVLLKEDHGTDFELNERLLPPGQVEVPLEDLQAERTRPLRKDQLKNCLKHSSLALVVISLTTYAFFMGILVGIHWKNRTIDIVCLERISQPCTSADILQEYSASLLMAGNLQHHFYPQSSQPGR